MRSTRRWQGMSTLSQAYPSPKPFKLHSKVLVLQVKKLRLYVQFLIGAHIAFSSWAKTENTGCYCFKRKQSGLLVRCNSCTRTLASREKGGKDGPREDWLQGAPIGLLECLSNRKGNATRSIFFFIHIVVAQPCQYYILSPHVFPPLLAPSSLSRDQTKTSI